MRTAVPSLLPLFRSGMQVEMLGLLMLQPDREWTMESLAQSLDAPQSSVHRELRRAVDAGLVLRDRRRRPHGYRASTTSPAYRPLRELLELTTGVAGRLSEALRDLPGVMAVSLHGSWAAETVRPDSDLDIVIITDGDRRTALRAARRVAREVAREADASVMTPEDFSELVRLRNPFVGKLLHGPRLDVVGDLDAVASSR